MFGLGDEKEEAVEGEDPDGQVPPGHDRRHGCDQQEQEQERGSGGVRSLH